MTRRLTPSEAAIYAAITGEQTISEIVEITGKPRGTVVPALGVLHMRGLLAKRFEGRSCLYRKETT